jgi:hypothetical protein
MPKNSPVLDWSKTGGAGDPAACTLCGRPAICRSPKGAPVHKTCAEVWTAARRGRRSEFGRAA